MRGLYPDYGKRTTVPISRNDPRVVLAPALFSSTVPISGTPDQCHQVSLPVSIHPLGYNGPPFIFYTTIKIEQNQTQNKQLETKHLDKNQYFKTDRSNQNIHILCTSECRRHQPVMSAVSDTLTFDRFFLIQLMQDLKTMLSQTERLIGAVIKEQQSKVNAKSKKVGVMYQIRLVSKSSRPVRTLLLEKMNSKSNMLKSNLKCQTMPLFK